MSAGIQADEESLSPDLPPSPIASEDLAGFGVDHLIPFFISTTLQIERSRDGSPPPPLSPAEAEDLIEILDKVRLTL